MAETACPLCELPRPPGARRCVCYYTFEYDAPRGGSAGSTRAGMAPIVLLAAALAMVVAWIVAADLGPQQGIAGLVLVPAGAFAVAGAALDWTWFFGDRRARVITAVFGRVGGRVIYALIGGALVGLGARFVAL